MIDVLTPAEMRAADAQAVAASGVEKLMRNAGGAIAAYVREHLPRGSRIVAFAGPGNNGGDARAAFAQLEGYDCALVAPDEMPHDDASARAMLEGAALAIDALFGTGARLPLPERYAPAIRALDARERRVLAIDIPSGVDALTGAVPGDAVRASATITLAAMKPGLLFPPAREHCGELWIARIGIDEATLHAHAASFAALDDAGLLALLPHRADGADKRSAGAPLIIAGSQQFPGAAVLCARGAARAGAGYVTVATAPGAAATLRTHLIEQVVVEIADDLLDIAQRNSAAGIGPGLGLDDRTGEIVRGFVERCDLPMVIDASALFHFGKHLDLLRGKRCVLTPHEGEFARLSGLGTVAPGTRVERLREFTSRTGITTLLKGPATLIDDGARTYINASGTSVLATAGTGDVLTGMIATLLGQGLSPLDAACAGAYWHGLAARYCASARPVGVVAGDLPEALAATLRSLAPTTGALRRVYA
ncbi:MAG TPA: NAD(P)H-hydrate dehydratase [Candidatus Acidoferrales bacterium]|nr:NAD(P)H-hydrate dehydratase [Candidatus Acidoferrales bacterium]